MTTQEKYDERLKIISKNIRKIRLSRNLTQENMQDHGFNYRYYQKLESGRYSMGIYTLHRLAEVFEVDVKDFF